MKQKSSTRCDQALCLSQLLEVVGICLQRGSCCSLGSAVALGACHSRGAVVDLLPLGSVYCDSPLLTQCQMQNIGGEVARPPVSLPSTSLCGTWRVTMRWVTAQQALLSSAPHWSRHSGGHQAQDIHCCSVPCPDASVRPELPSQLWERASPSGCASCCANQQQHG